MGPGDHRMLLRGPGLPAMDHPGNWMGRVRPCGGSRLPPAAPCIRPPPQTSRPPQGSHAPLRSCCSPLGDSFYFWPMSPPSTRGQLIPGTSSNARFLLGVFPGVPRQRRPLSAPAGPCALNAPTGQALARRVLNRKRMVQRAQSPPAELKGGWMGIVLGVCESGAMDSRACESQPSG